jgi:hypothetical protein
MNTLIDLIGLLALLGNGLFALHIWFGVSHPAYRRARARPIRI